MEQEPSLSPFAIPEPADRAKPRSGLVLDSQGCTHALKLRDSIKLTDDGRTRLELGLDFRLGTGAWGGRSLAARLQPGGAPPAWLLGGLAPWAALQHQLDPQDRGAGLLRADPGHLSFSRRLTPRNGGRLPELTAKLGLSYDGQPHAALGFGSLSLTLAVGAAMLAAGRTVRVTHQEVGMPGLALHFPLTWGGKQHQETLTERVEVGASLERQGRGLRLHLRELNGVMRLRED